MQKTTLTAALCLTMATSAMADTTSASKIKPGQLRDDLIVSSQSVELSGAASSVQIVIPLMLLTILAVAASSGGGSGYSDYYLPY